MFWRGEDWASLSNTIQKRSVGRHFSQNYPVVLPPATQRTKPFKTQSKLLNFGLSRRRRRAETNFIFLNAEKSEHSPHGYSGDVQTNHPPITVACPTNALGRISSSSVVSKRRCSSRFVRARSSSTGIRNLVKSC